jgi:hypothetical protein
MAQILNSQDIVALDSITHLKDAHRGQVVAAGSHGAVYAAYLAAKGGVRAVILNDAGIGKDQAGISGLAYLDQLGIAGAVISHRSARIGEGADMMARGTISHVNQVAAALGCVTGQSCADCAAAMIAAQHSAITPPDQTETRMKLRAEPQEPEVWGLDSASLILPEDSGRILIVGSHGQTLGGRPETALKYDAVAAVFSDAGIGADQAGLSRLPALDARGIPAAAVSADSARIGDGRSLYEDGVISRVNDRAAAMGAAPGTTTRQFILQIIAGLR